MSRPLAVLAAAMFALPSHAAAQSWAWPLRGVVAGTFHVSPATPYAAGQRRGIDIAGRPGVTVRAACPGRVRFAGPLPGRGLAVTIACGGLRATYLRLGSLRVRAGARVTRGAPIGRLGAAGLLRLGARRSASAHGYLDPLTLLRDERHAPRAPPPAALRRPPPPRVAAPPRAVPAVAPGRPGVPLAAWLAAALVASGLPVGELVRSRRRRRTARAEGRARAARL